MHSSETIGAEHLAGFTPGDVARWFVALVLVAGLGSGGFFLARRWTPPAGEASAAAAPAVLLELEPLAVPEPEPEIAPTPPVAEPLPEPEPAPEVEPLAEAPVTEPELVEEPIAEPEEVAEPPRVAEEPQLQPDAATPFEALPEPAPGPVPEPLPEANDAAVAFPMPALMSADLRQRRADTPSTNPQRPHTASPPDRPRVQPVPQAAPQQPVPVQPAAASAGPTVEQWRQQLNRQIDRAKRYPRQAERAGQEGLVHVAVTIDSSGRLLSASVIRSSGFTALDEAAIEAVRRAAPFPRPPASAGQGTIPFTAPIRFNTP